MFAINNLKSWQKQKKCKTCLTVNATVGITPPPPNVKPGAERPKGATTPKAGGRNAAAATVAPTYPYIG